MTCLDFTQIQTLQQCWDDGHEREGGEREKWFKDTEEKMRVENVGGAKRSLFSSSAVLGGDGFRILWEWTCLSGPGPSFIGSSL